MYGAIIGDIVGSRFEFTTNKTKDFDLFTEDVNFTDDTVMTIAIADALIGQDSNDINVIKTSIVMSMLRWGHKYMNCGFGGMFHSWLLGSTNYMPYNSYGNGSAMRVSSVGWLYDSLEKTQTIAKYTAEVTHNHQEGIKGAESVASAIWLARHKYDKEYIKQYIKDTYKYNLDRTCDEIRKVYTFNVTCQKTVPEAIISFLEGNSYEEVIRLAISLGGDADTIGAIAGSIAEAYYGIPNEFIKKCNKIIPKEMIKVINQFKEKIKEGN